MTAATVWSIWSTTARLVVTDPGALDGGRAACEEILDDVTRAASRFEPDSEISRLATDGRPQQVSELLAALVAEALGAAAATDGAVDPTVGGTLIDLGYDRDISLVRAGTAMVARIRPVPGWKRVRLEGSELTLPEGAVLDLGATAKAGAADRCARAVAGRFRCGALVSLGGDIATAGTAPEGGWQVEVRDLPGDAPARITLPERHAVSTSSSRRRTWLQGGDERHHLIDPATSLPVRGPWGAVTVVARTCVAANAASTAAMVKGPDAVAWLHRIGLPARALRADGTVAHFGAWPRQDAA